jgi:Cu/Ag efflux protein CusF
VPGRKNSHIARSAGSAAKTACARRVFATIGVLLLFFVVSSCSRGADKESTGPEKHYTMRGVILSLDAKNQTANIDHEAIEGWMEAMTMDYPVRSKADFSRLHTGEHITATINVRGTDYDLTNIQEQKTPQ